MIQLLLQGAEFVFLFVPCELNFLFDETCLGLFSNAGNYSKAISEFYLCTLVDHVSLLKSGFFGLFRGTDFRHRDTLAG